MGISERTKERVKIVPARYLGSDLKNSVFPGFRILALYFVKAAGGSDVQATGTLPPSFLGGVTCRSAHLTSQTTSFNSIPSVARTLLNGRTRLMYQQGAISQVPWRSRCHSLIPWLLTELGPILECTTSPCRFS